jgi:hypothetical protein
MKKILILSIICLLLVTSVMVYAQKRAPIALFTNVKVTFVNQEPDPAEPGQYVDVRIKVENNGSEQAKQFEIELLPEFPFSLDPGINPVESLGALNTRQFGENALVIKYKVRIDKNAVAGDNELKFRYKYDSSVWIEPEPVIIEVQTRDAIISVDSISKNSIEPGSSSSVRIRVTNNADSVLRDIRIDLDLGDKNFVPVGSTNEKNIYKLDAGESYEFVFDMIANPEATAGAYQVPLRIVYNDDLGKTYIKNSTIGIVINAKPDLSITLDSTEIYESGKSGEVVIKVVNKGLTDIKFANMELMPSGDYKILSNKEAYLGNIDSDDFETADFNIFVEKTGVGSIKVPVSMEYKDANNNDFKDSYEVELNLYTSSEAKKLGLKENGNSMNIIITIIVIVAGFFLYKRYKKRKKV